MKNKKKENFFLCIMDHSGKMKDEKINKCSDLVRELWNTNETVSAIILGDLLRKAVNIGWNTLKNTGDQSSTERV